MLWKSEPERMGIRAQFSLHNFESDAHFFRWEGVFKHFVQLFNASLGAQAGLIGLDGSFCQIDVFQSLLQSFLHSREMDFPRAVNVESHVYPFAGRVLPGMNADQI